MSLSHINGRGGVGGAGTRLSEKRGRWRKKRLKTTDLDLQPEVSRSRSKKYFIYREKNIVADMSRN